MSLRNRPRIKPLADAWDSARFARRAFDLAQVVAATGRHELLTAQVVVSRTLLAEGNDSTAHLIAGTAYGAALEHARNAMNVPEDKRWTCQFVRRPDESFRIPRLDAVRRAKEQALVDQDFEAAAAWRDEERRLVGQHGG